MRNQGELCTIQGEIDVFNMEEPGLYFYSGGFGSGLCSLKSIQVNARTMIVPLVRQPDPAAPMALTLWIALQR